MKRPAGKIRGAVGFLRRNSDQRREKFKMNLVHKKKEGKISSVVQGEEYWVHA